MKPMGPCDCVQNLLVMDRVETSLLEKGGKKNRMRFFKL